MSYTENTSSSSPCRFPRTGKVFLIYTGGTIGMGHNPDTGALEPLDFNHLMDNVPEFKQLPTKVDVYQFTPPIDSSDISPRQWAQLVRIISQRYDEYDGFVILHGTDTMAYTASALSFLLENLTKPVILTGSQLPIGQLRTDGKENMMTSLELASACHEDGTPMVPEVCIYFNGKLIRGNRATKQNADGFNAFDSFNYPHLCDAGVNLVFHEHEIRKPDFTKPMIPHTAIDSNIVVLSLFPGLQESIIRHVLESPELRSIVMRSFGSGNAPQTPWLARLLKEATYRGVLVVNISQCLSGCVEMDRYNTGYQLHKSGVISGHDSTVEAAVTKLMCLQGRYQDVHIIRTLMDRNIAGEISV
ncbi:MAG: type I asparaginase [Prevotella sp.]|nr:type I asparaginase [Prevotella sp.]